MTLRLYDESTAEGVTGDTRPTIVSWRLGAATLHLLYEDKAFQADLKWYYDRVDELRRN